jgi:hypothetical protein
MIASEEDFGSAAVVATASMVLIIVDDPLAWVEISAEADEAIAILV